MKDNQLKIAVIFSYSSKIIGYVIAIVFTPIMLRILGQSEYGLYNLVSSVVSYLGLLSFGFSSAYMRNYSRYTVNNEQEKVAKLNGMFFIVFLVLGFVAIIAGGVLIFNIDYIFAEKLTMKELATAKVLMGVMVFNIALSFPTSIFNSHIIANEEHIFQKVLQMIKIIANPFIMLPVLLMGYKSVGMVLVTTTLNIAVEIANVVFCFKKLKIKFLFRQFDFSLMREITVFSSYVFLNIIIDQINWNIDKFILGRFRGTIAVAIYGLAAQLNGHYLSLSTVISSVFIPRINRMVAVTNDNKELTNLLTKVGRVQFMILSLILSGIVFFGQPFINMWAGTNYNTSYTIMLLLMIPVTIPLIQNLGEEIQRAKNMHKFSSWVYLFIAVVNLFVSIPLAKRYGGIGSALGTSFSLLIGNGLIMNWYYHKKVGLNMKYFWSQILKFIPALLPPIIVGVLMFKFIDLYSIIPFLICWGIYVVIFCVFLWLLGMNQYEKDFFRKPILKILIKLRQSSNKM